jgi:hypothetical protein
MSVIHPHQDDSQKTNQKSKYSAEEKQKDQEHSMVESKQ